jgi:Tfp pilus assembly protein PilF
LTEQQTITIQQAIDLAVQHHIEGRLPEAEAIYQQILQVEPNHYGVLHLLGVIAHQGGKNDIAVDLIGKALIIEPNFADAHSNLGIVLKEQGKLDDAVASYHRALAINPDDAEAHSNLGIVLKKQGKLDDAVAKYHKALAINPDFAEAHNNLGNAFKEQGKLDDAVASFNKALAINPDDAGAHSNLGIVLTKQGKLDDAVASYHKALAIKPDFAEAHSSLGNAFKEQGKLDDAVASYEKSLAVRPDNDGLRIRKALSLPVIFESAEDMETRRSKLINTVRALQNKPLIVDDSFLDIGMANFYLAYHSRNNKSIHENIAELHISACPKLNFKAVHCNLTYERKPGPLRIGFLSTYLQNHTVGKLFKGVIEHFSRDKFEVIVFQKIQKPDEMPETVSQAAERAVPLCKNLERDWATIAGEELDILFYLDIRPVA